VCRYKGLGDSSDDEWHLNDGAVLTYTFIHFSSDDLAASDVANALTGWWKVEYGGRTTFTFFWSDGKASRSPTAPRSAADRPHAGDSAYWFQFQGSGKFAWKGTGDLEEWTISGTGKSMIVRSGAMNGISGNVTKVF